MATLLCSEENSSAKIFIPDAPLAFTQNFDLNPAELQMRNAKFETRYRRIPSLGPFDHRHAFGLIKVLLQTGSLNLFQRLQTKQIQMKQRETAPVVGVDQSE